MRKFLSTNYTWTKNIYIHVSLFIDIVFYGTWMIFMTSQEMQNLKSSYFYILLALGAFLVYWTTTKIKDKLLNYLTNLLLDDL